MLRILLFVLLSLSYVQLPAQAKYADKEFRLHLNVNQLYPSGNSDLGYYPILWYSSTASSKLLAGGFGIGLSYHNELNKQLFLRTRLNLQRSRFYDQPTHFNDLNSSALGAFFGVNTSYNINVQIMPNVKFGANQRWSFGLGAGTRVVLSSISDYGEAFVDGEVRELKFKRRSQAPIVAYTTTRLRFAIRKLEFSIGLDIDFTNSSTLDGQLEKYYIWQTGIAYILNKKVTD